MEKENLKQIITILNNAIESNHFGNDISVINDLYNYFSNLQEENINIKELESVRQRIIELEVNYDEFTELSYYFESIYIYLKKLNHNIEVKKLREQNRKNRAERR